MSPPPSPSDPASPHPGWAHFRGAGGPFLSLSVSTWFLMGVASLSEPPGSCLGLWGFHSQPPQCPTKLGELGTVGTIGTCDYWSLMERMTLSRWRAPGKAAAVQEAGSWALQRAGEATLGTGPRTTDAKSLPPQQLSSPASCAPLLSTSFLSPVLSTRPGSPRWDPLGSALWPAGLRRGASGPGDSLTMRKAIRRLRDFGQIASHLGASIFNP